MREPRPEWVQALKATCGADHDLRWNETVSRWEFVIPSADGIPRSQFWGQFWHWKQGKRVPLKPDPVTGLYPFRDLDDHAMREALANLTRTYIGNPHDGAGTPDKEVRQRIAFNAERQKYVFRQAGNAFADLVAERARRIRGAPQVTVVTNLTKE